MHYEATETLHMWRLPYTSVYCSWRYIKFDENGKLLVTIGVPCNICDVDDPKVGNGGTGKFRYGEGLLQSTNQPTD
jgi:glucose/arabinose dehydrogenase